jgi:SP family general alpha glucoside:H+ symporter-like MFS transporter
MWPVPLIVGIYLAPESPWWLVRKGRMDDAKHALKRLTHSKSGAGSEADGTHFSLDETISMMSYTNEMEREAESGTSYLDLFRGKVALRRTEIVCMVWSVQQLCGSSLQAYSTYFFEQAGMDDSNAFTMSMVMYAIGACGTMASWFMMQWFGRRTLYLWGQLAMFLCLIIIGCVSFAGKENTAAQWTIGSMLIVITFIYDCTVGPVCFSLVAELTSTRTRIKGVVLARNVYNIVGIVANVLTPRMLNPTAWNWGAKAGFFWGASCLLCAIWTYWRLPEPKDRSFAELDILFERGVPARKFASTQVESLAAGLEVDEKRMVVPVVH